MNILIHEKNIRRNAKIGQYTSLASLIILAGGMYISFIYPALIYVSFAALLVGFVTSQVGIYFGNRWGRHPRADERLTAALKGLTRDYTMYHYLTPVNHLLVGPAGIWIIEPYYQRGTIKSDGKKWTQKGGGFLLAYLKIFAQEGLGRPDIEIKSDLENMNNAFKKALLDGQELPPINAVLVFTDDRVILDAAEAPNPTLKLDQLKEFFRKTAKQTPFPASEIKRITALLPVESVE